jgi:hypothetical protein
MTIIRDALTVEELRQLAGPRFGNMVKAVVDIDRERVAIDADLHADLEAVLLEDGSMQKSLWGINLYLELGGDDFIEFDSMINMRPSQGNRSRGVEDEAIRARITKVVQRWIVR